MRIESQIGASLKSEYSSNPIPKNKYKLTKRVVYYFICRYFGKLSVLGFVALFLSQVLILALVLNLQSAFGAGDFKLIRNRSQQEGGILLTIGLSGTVDPVPFSELPPELSVSHRTC